MYSCRTGSWLCSWLALQLAFGIAFGCTKIALSISSGRENSQPAFRLSVKFAMYAVILHNENFRADKYHTLSSKDNEKITRWHKTVKSELCSLFCSGLGLRPRGDNLRTALRQNPASRPDRAVSHHEALTPRGFLYLGLYLYLLPLHALSTA